MSSVLGPALLASAFTTLVTGCGRLGFDLLGSSGQGGTSTAGGRGAIDGSVASGGTGASGGGSATGGGSSGGGASGIGGSMAVTDASRGGTVSGGASGAGPGDSGAAGATTVPPALDAASTVQTFDVLDPTQLVLSGMAQISGSELLVPPAIRNAAGAAYLPSPYAITSTTSFVVSFSFRIYSTSVTGDGLAFLFQNDPRGTTALGNNGASMGYDGIVPSVIVEFDTQPNTWDSGLEEVAITTNGDYMTSLAYVNPPFPISDGSVLYAWIEYDGAGKTLSVYLAQSSQHPASALVSAPVDFPAILGSSTYIGFTGSGSASIENNAILSLSVDYFP